MTLTLDDVLGKLAGLTPAKRREVEKLANEATKNLAWLPNVGPQMTAYFHPADVLLYGGAGGAGAGRIQTG